MMKAFKTLLPCTVALLGTVALSASPLKTKEILGKEYFVYEVKKGDSLYGVSHRYGWDEKELVRLNPSLSEGMKKGLVIYYPTGRETTLTQESSTDADSPSVPLVPEDLPPITHLIKRGETVYSISGLYGISVDDIYRLYPSAKNGIKAGDTLVLDQRALGFGTERPYFFYTIKPGDTLYSIAKSNNSTVEALLASNLGISETSLRPLTLIRVPVESTRPKYTRTLVEKEEVGSLSSYLVGKDDTWTGISRKTGATVEELREANPDVKSLKKNEVVAVPSMETVNVEKEVEYTDPREDNAEGRRQIYDSIHHISDSEIQAVRIALIMDDPSARRDAEFTRGYLLALREMENPGYKVGFKVISGAEAVDEVVNQLNDYNPQLVINLSDKGTPAWMTAYGERTGTETVNIFDVKGDAYVSSPSVIQLMTPSAFMYDNVCEALEDEYPRHKLMVVGDLQSDDPLRQALMAGLWGEAKVMAPEDLKDFAPGPDSDYVIYADISDRNGIETFFTHLELLKEANPSAGFAVVGKPSWIMYTEPFAEKLYTADVWIPSRFYFQSDSEKGRAFIEAYTDEYGRGPLKSYPNYAAAGYDTANYFIPALALNEGDFNISVPDADPLQTPIALQRYSNWGGFYNPQSLLLHFTPYRTVERTVLK